jgi:hypothetical protein
VGVASATVTLLMVQVGTLTFKTALTAVCTYRLSRVCRSGTYSAGLSVA